MDVVFPIPDVAQVSLSSGQLITIRKGEHWSTQDRVVRERPDLFSADPRYGLAFSTPPPEMADPPVESATAAPGERRQVRRPRTSEA